VLADSGPSAQMNENLQAAPSKNDQNLNLEVWVTVSKWLGFWPLTTVGCKILLVTE
jgi:hypothetical protein